MYIRVGIDKRVAWKGCLHSTTKKYDKTETFWSSIVRAVAAAAAAAGTAVEATEAIGDHCC